MYYFVVKEDKAGRNTSSSFWIWFWPIGYGLKDVMIQSEPSNSRTSFQCVSRGSVVVRDGDSWLSLWVWASLKVKTDPFSWDQRPIFRIPLLTKLSFIFYLSILFPPSPFATLIFSFFSPGLLSVFSPSLFSIYSTKHDSNIFENFIYNKLLWYRL